MAFNRNYFGRISSTANTLANTMWSYKSTDDSVAAIVTSDYFSDATSLAAGDTITIGASDDVSMVAVTGLNPVTVNTFTTADYDLGAWALKSFNLEYTANTDGFVMMWVENVDAVATGAFVAESPVGTPRTSCYTYLASNYFQSNASLCMPVRKTDTWKVINTSSGTFDFKLWWIPVGS